MSMEKRGVPLNEGQVKKGGINSQPVSQRPNMPPPAQKPSASSAQNQGNGGRKYEYFLILQGSLVVNETYIYASYRHFNVSGLYSLLQNTNFCGIIKK